MKVDFSLEDEHVTSVRAVSSGRSQGLSSLILSQYKCMRTGEPFSF